MVKEPFFSTFVSTGEFSEFVDSIFHLAESKPSSYVCFANAHMVVEAHRDPAFNKVVNEADVVAPDGKPLAVFLRLARGMNQPRVCGMDILPVLLREAERRSKAVYFYGTQDTTLDAIRKKANAEFPNLRIAGMYSPPFRALTADEENDIVARINDSRPDLLFVALGCPKQEKWMAAHKDKINACMLGLGQAFQVYAGLEKRLPVWMRNLSLEWLYRFYLEPKRLWKRYLVTNSMFLFLSAKYILAGAFRR